VGGAGVWSRRPTTAYDNCQLTALLRAKDAWREVVVRGKGREDAEANRHNDVGGAS